MDIQTGLHVVLSETNGANVTRHVHGIRGIYAHKDAANNWEWPLPDGLGSVREVVDNSVAVLESRNYDPFGNGFGNTGTSQTNYGFTGELVDDGGLLDLRARRYAPGLGVFASLEPFEGVRDRAMSLNGYNWVEGNVPNAVDPSGEQCQSWNDMIHGSTGGCLPDNENCGDYRRRKCIQLKERFFDLGGIPDYDDIKQYYECGMSGFNRYADYVLMLNAAKNDGIIAQSEYDRTIEFARRNPDLLGLGSTLPEITPEDWTNAIGGEGQGYIEGFSYSGQLFFGALGGREIVYNFVNFHL